MKFKKIITKIQIFRSVEQRQTNKFEANNSNESNLLLCSVISFVNSFLLLTKKALVLNVIVLNKESNCNMWLECKLSSSNIVWDNLIKTLDLFLFFRNEKKKLPNIDKSK